ncbi:YceI family protein [Alteromonas sp. SM 2104]|nr:YceI family protein [Alteromonas oceanisediminis]
MRLFATFLVLVSFHANADWRLDPQRSALHFVSTKNVHIAETHSFDEFSGKLNNKGELTVSINVASVNTLIDIRNTRMRDMLFNVSDFATAEFMTALPADVMAMATGDARMLTITGSLTLHGKTVEMPVTVHVTKLIDNTFSAVTVKPILVDARQFDLETGVDALQAIAALNNISHTVPVSFAVTFAPQ